MLQVTVWGRRLIREKEERQFCEIHRLLRRRKEGEEGSKLLCCDGRAEAAKGSKLFPIFQSLFASRTLEEGEVDGGLMEGRAGVWTK